MSAIRSALDEMAGVNDNDLSPRELASDLVEPAHAIRMMKILKAQRLKALADRDNISNLPGKISCPTPLVRSPLPGNGKRNLSPVARRVGGMEGEGE